MANKRARLINLVSAAALCAAASTVGPAPDVRADGGDATKLHVCIKEKGGAIQRVAANEGCGQNEPAPLHLINAGAGLVTVSGPEVTIAIADGGVTTAKLADEAVTNAKLQNPSLKVEAGTGLTGGGTVPLGGTVQLSLDVVPIAKGGTGLTSGPTAPGQYLRSSGPGAWSIGSIAPGHLPAGSAHYIHNSTATQAGASFNVAGSGAIGGHATIGGHLNLAPSSAAGGVIRQGPFTLIHSFGLDNFFAGRSAGDLTTTGARNTGVGALALVRNTSGVNNTGVGAGALNRNTTGFDNTASGAGALTFNTEGRHNTATGVSALRDNTTGGSNTAGGAFALSSNTTGSGNTATGATALGSNTTGSRNTATGSQALLANTEGIRNTATGASALASNTTGGENTASGHEALAGNTAGVRNTASGTHALAANTVGNLNTAVGDRALAANTGGSNNTAVGTFAGVGPIPAHANTTGSNNTFIGHNTGSSTSAPLTNATAIGANAQVGASNALVLGDGNVNVGVGTATPRSTLQVVGDYIQFPAISGAPAAEDCDEAAEAGRVVVRVDGSVNLYVCRGMGGWVGK